MNRPILPALVLTRTTLDAAVTQSSGIADLLVEVQSPTTETHYTDAELYNLFGTPLTSSSGASYEIFVTAPNSPAIDINVELVPVADLLHPPNALSAEPMDPNVTNAAKVLGKRKKALLIGISYEVELGSQRLTACHRDVDDMKEFLCHHWSWSSSEVVVMKDDGSDPSLHPSRENIIKQLHVLINGAKPGDHLFFHFSGHGGQTADKDGDEDDLLDEVILSADLSMILDDELHAIIVQPLPPGCRLTAVFDCCSSGTALDLPHLSPPSTKDRPPLATASPLTATPRRPVTPTSPRTRTVLDLPNNYDSRPPEHELTHTIPKGRKKYSRGDVIMWSACRDWEKAGEVITKDQRERGAMTHAFIESLKAKPRQSYQELLDALTDMLYAWELPQVPQMSSAQTIDMSEVFSLD